MRALFLRYRAIPKEGWGGCDDSELVRYCFGGSDSQTQETETEPWGPQQDYLKELFYQSGQNILNRPLEFFPGKTWVPYSPETRRGMQLQSQRAREGSPLLRGTQGYTGDVLSGDYLSGSGVEGANPALMRESVVAAVEPAVSSRWASAGRSGRSPLANEAFGRGVTRALAPYEFEAAERAADRGSREYLTERGFMEGAAARAPALAREDYFDITKLGEVGALREAKKREKLADRMARWDFYQNEPANRIERYGRNIQGNYGGTSTGTTTGGGPNPLLMGTGAALSLAGLPVAGPAGAAGGSLLGNAIASGK